MGGPVTINTGGGASVGGDVQAARDFIGRDQFNIAVHLNGVDDAARAVQAISQVLGRGDLESESVRSSLLGVMEELRRTHATIVKAISPLRRIKDDVKTFADDFGKVYNDFRDFYDTSDLWEERTHCHRVRLIRRQLEKHVPTPSTPEWDQLLYNLNALSNADIDVIEYYYEPFLRRFNDVMVKIDQHVSDGEIEQAITLKRVFLGELAGQYDGIKNMLRLMTDTIADIETSLV
ncbi:MAG: hypothetical protein AB8I69_15710 [Anaerolineae bacterium]|jgi:hypothetical protein